MEPEAPMKRRCWPFCHIWSSWVNVRLMVVHEMNGQKYPAGCRDVQIRDCVRCPAQQVRSIR